MSDSALAARRAAMRAALADCSDAAALHVDFYDRRRLASWVNAYPGTIVWVRERTGEPLAGWPPFADWSSSPTSLADDYLTDGRLRISGAALGGDRAIGAADALGKLRQILGQRGTAVRLVGLSGVGKTRFVKALFDAKIGANALDPAAAIYTDLADNPDPVPLELLARIEHLASPAIVIVDNCGIALHRKLVARLQASAASIRLITVEYDISDDASEHTDVIHLEPASSEVIETVVKRRYTKLSGLDAAAIARFSEGNFRVALALAETARAGESLAKLADSELFGRLFRQRNDDDPALLRAAMAAALVYSFDGDTLGDETDELPIVARLAGQGSRELYPHVAELRRRQLVQARGRWRAVLPHELVHRRARQALASILLGDIRTIFTKLAPRRLLISFSRRLG